MHNNITGMLISMYHLGPRCYTIVYYTNYQSPLGRKQVGMKSKTQERADMCQNAHSKLATDAVQQENTFHKVMSF